MNHLRDLIDALPYHVGFDDGVWKTTATPFNFLRWTKEKAEEAVCFDMGQIDGIIKLKTMLELFKLPFRRCWFEASFEMDGDRTKEVNAGIFCTEIDEEFLGLVYSRTPDKHWALEGTVRSVGTPIRDFEIVSAKIAYREIQILMTGFTGFISAMNCQNVHRKEHKPNTALQKARAKRGKQPLFSYWTLELNGRDGGAAQSFGGTHASPRVHLRRGHPRQYAPGKWTWVQPCAVGNRELGMVHKDYVVGKELVTH